MSRKHPRVHVRLTATVTVEGSNNTIVCPTRDISQTGCYLDTAEPLRQGTRLEIALLDHDYGEAVDLDGEVMRVGERGVGVLIHDPPEGWLTLVDRYHSQSGSIWLTNMPRRLRILVIGDDERRRGALALYVTSGWDVRFASDLHGAREALRGVKLDAVIAEHELDSDNWQAPLSAAQAVQPNARRIVRCSLPFGRTPPADQFGGLIDRVVDADSGMDALLDALTADLGAGSRDTGGVASLPDD